MNAITWKCPSNIALVKYWGKKGDQLPANPSVSFTLHECHTMTTLHYMEKEDDGTLPVTFMYDDQPMPSFEPKLETFFKRVESLFPFLTGYRIDINTKNTFPHSSGIASSASGFGALALCLCSMEQEIKGNPSGEDFFRKASFAARLGSGSACRSVYGPATVWGKSDYFENSSDEYAVKVPSLHPVFRNYCDSILIVDKGSKAVSSSAGHSLLDAHPFASVRFQEAVKNTGHIKKALESGDLELFNRITEQEAMMLHAMMMTSDPSFILMQPNTLAIIHQIRNERKALGLHLTITLDAGANVHVLYPVEEKKKAEEYIQYELLPFCAGHLCVHDETGEGPQPVYPV